MEASRGRNSAEEISTAVRSLGWWYQCFELPFGVMTSSGRSPAYYPETRWQLIEPFVPASLEGKTVLDVGGNAGFFSLQMMKRGAKSCTIVEPFSEFAAQARYVAGLYNYEINVVNEDVHSYCLTTDERFDYVLFLGLFYHLKYPGIVLDRLAEMARERLYFQSLIIGDDPLNYEARANYQPGQHDVTLQDPSFPRMLFVENLYNGDPTNWWIPNGTALEPLIRSSGLRTVARPHPQVIVAEPERPFGKVVYNKLVFPCYGKRDGSVFPGPQHVDKSLWERLISDERDQH